ncbi:hypothetical protein MRY82_00670 [bacterium]|nr:hypothetical protein [bacterium]
MSKKLLVLCLCLGLAAPSMVFAKKRAKKQSQRIKQSVKSGQLTKEEAVGLREDGKAIREEVKSAKADGTVDQAERAKIKEMRQERSKKIYQEKHDEERMLSKDKRKKMKQAVRSGKMTSEQAKEIESESMKIREQRKSFMKNDNKIDEQEREQLKKMREALRAKTKSYMKEE